MPLRSAPSTSEIVNFIPYRIRCAAEQLRHKNTGNGGAQERARALLSRRRARPSSGTDRRPQP
eukprot:6194894-Pleurochrysis_carterae.AAC.1